MYQRYQQQRVHPDELRSHTTQAAHFSVELSSTPDAQLHLTRREREILALVAQGLQNKEIAANLAVSPQTVYTHLRTIYDKLEVTGRAAVIRMAVSMRLG